MARPPENVRLDFDWLVPSTASTSAMTDLYFLHWPDRTRPMPTPALVRLLSELGVHETTTRTALRRMVQAGYLVRRVGNRGSGYAMTPAWASFMDSGTPGYEAYLAGRESGPGWTVLSVNVPERRRSDRHVLRTMLTKTGCGTVSPGVWIAPGRRGEYFLELVDGMGLTAYVTAFEADHCGPQTPVGLVERCWDMAALRDRHAAFVREQRAVLSRWRRSRTGTDPARDQRAFVDLQRAHTAWRLAVAPDPCLPSEVLPRNWPGMRTREVLVELRGGLLGPAQDHFDRVIDESQVSRGRRPGDGNRPVNRRVA